MNTVTQSRIEMRVLRGAAFLDKHHKGWWRKIRTTSLDMSESHVCIIGQLVGGYNPRDLGIKRGTQEIAMGFETTKVLWKHYNHDKQVVYYELLDELWKEQVRKRRTKAQA